MILVDTSVWTDHFRAPLAILAGVLERDEVVTHPFVIGELACGQFKRRREVLDLLRALRSVSVASNEEVLQLIEHHRLMGKSIGYIDVHLLASVMLTPDVRLWTADRRLASVAGTLGVAFDVRSSRVITSS